MLMQRWWVAGSEGDGIRRLGRGGDRRLRRGDGGWWQKRRGLACEKRQGLAFLRRQGWRFCRGGKRQRLVPEAAGRYLCGVGGRRFLRKGDAFFGDGGTFFGV